MNSSARCASAFFLSFALSQSSIALTSWLVFASIALISPASCSEKFLTSRENSDDVRVERLELLDCALDGERLQPFELDARAVADERLLAEVGAQDRRRLSTARREATARRAAMAWGSYYKGMRISLSAVSREARAECAQELPFEPRPVFRVGRRARLIVGQAPGRRVHETGIPWNDPRAKCCAWLALDREAFYDTSRIAIVPIGLLSRHGGRRGSAAVPRCAPLAAALPRGAARYPPHPPRRRLRAGVLPEARRKKTLADTVRAWRDYLPEFFPLPHRAGATSGGARAIPGSRKTCFPLRRRAD